MLAERGMYDSHIEEDLTRVGNLLELAKCAVELIVIIERQG